MIEARELIERLGRLPEARPLLERLTGHPGVYLVGGAVRDLLIDRSPRELDLVSEREVGEMAEALGGRVRSHDRFGTATVEVDGHTYDLARTRRERYARPGALPEVEPAGIEEDLRRRDFTVNAIAVPLWGEAPRLIAVDEAEADLAAGRLRVMHGASFRDDPTRILRLARYAARLGFAAEPVTERLVVGALAEGALQTVSGPRIGAELRLLAAEPDPVAAFERLRELGADEAVHRGFGLQEPDLAARGLALLPVDGDRGELVLAVAARGVPGDETAELLDRLAFPSASRDRIMAAAGDAEALARRLAGAGRPSEIARAVGGAAPELVALAGALGAETQAQAWLGDLRQTRLGIRGGDLLAAGVEAGPAVGAGLAAALEAKLDGRTRGREDELAVAVAAARAAAQSGRGGESSG